MTQAGSRNHSRSLKWHQMGLDCVLLLITKVVRQKELWDANIILALYIFEVWSIQKTSPALKSSNAARSQLQTFCFISQGRSVKNEVYLCWKFRRKTKNDEVISYSLKHNWSYQTERIINLICARFDFLRGRFKLKCKKPRIYESFFLPHELVNLSLFLRKRQCFDFK